MFLSKVLFSWLLVASLLNVVSCASEGCATTNVNIRTGPSTSNPKIGLLVKDRCVPYLGLSSSGTWAKVQYSGRTAYIYKRYLSIRSITTNSNSAPTSTGCPRIISRAEWGARAATGSSTMNDVPRNVYIHHGTGSPCSTTTSCKAKVRGYQNYHMDTRGYDDIAYSFIVGEDGNVYEGRGWMKVGAHTYNHNTDGYGICIIGDFTNRTPNSAAINAVKNLIQCGVSKGQLRADYVLKGHRDVGSTACPGTSLYNLIKTWPHYMN